MKPILKKITLKSAGTELLGATGASIGVVGGSIIMKMAGKFLPYPWLASLIGILAGYGIRLAVDEKSDATGMFIRDIATGLLVAGTLDGVKKLLDQYGTSIPGLSMISSSIPALSGVDNVNYDSSMALRQNAILRGLKGFKGTSQPTSAAALLR